MFLATLAQAQAPRTHTYYIAADPVNWNYAPHGRNLAGLPQVQGSEEPAPTNVTYRKVMYREYTDATFTQLKPRAPEWEHLGILGPLIRAEVGDTVVIHFKNNSYNMATMHPHGLTYDKASEGALYLDGTEGNDKKDDAVPYGGTYYLHVGRTGIRRAGPHGRQFRHLDVPLPLRRTRRHEHRPHRPNHRHRPRKVQA